MLKQARATFPTPSGFVVHQEEEEEGPKKETDSFSACLGQHWNMSFVVYTIEKIVDRIIHLNMYKDI